MIPESWQACTRFEIVSSPSDEVEDGWSIRLERQGKGPTSS